MATKEGNRIHNKNWLSTTFKHGKWYILSSFFAKGLNIILLRVYTIYIPPSDYGVLDTLNSIAQFLPFFISLSLDSAFARFYHEYKYDEKKLKNLFSTIYLFILGFGVFTVFLVILSSTIWLNHFLEIPFFPFAYLAFIPSLFFQLGNLGLYFLRQSLQSKTTTIVETGSLLINMIVAIPLLIYVDFGILAKLWGNFAMSIAIFLFYTYYFLKNGLLRFNFKLEILKESLLFSLPLFPLVIGTWVTGFSDRLVIASYSSLESVGLYSVGFTIGRLIYIFQDAITQVIIPVSMSGLIHDRDNTKLKMAISSEILWILLLYINLGMFLFANSINSYISMLDSSQIIDNSFANAI